LKSHWIVVGLVGALVVWFFAPALGGASSFAFRDAAHYYYPLFEYIRGEWGAGRLPLWNPYENIGVPLIAENTSSVFYPGKLLFALPLDYTLLYNLYIVSHVALAAVTSYRLARHWDASALAAGVAALSYAFGGSVLFQYCNVIFLVGAAWLPWAAQLADRMLRQRKWGAAVGLGVVLALMIAGGDPQMAYNAGLLAVLYAVLLWRARAGDATASETAPRGPWYACRPALLATSAITGGLLSAVQILPTLEASPYSVRASYDAPRNVYEWAASLAQKRQDDNPTAWYAGLLGSSPHGHQQQVYQFSVQPWRAAELLWPNITGRAFPTHRRWLSLFGVEGNLWTPSLYIGLLPFLLAAVTWSLRRAAPIEVRWLSWMVLLGGAGSLGMYGIAWLIGLAFGGSELLDIGGEVGGPYWWMVVLLPNYVYFRYPAKWFVVASLGLSLLAARGWDQAWPAAGVRVRRWLVVLALASLAGLVAVAVGWRVIERIGQESSPRQLTGPFDSAGARWDVTGALVQTAVLSVVFLSWFSWAGPRLRWGGFARAGALAITALDLAVAQGGFLLYAPAEDWRTAPSVLKSLPERFADYRVFRQFGPLPPSWELSSSPERYTESLRWDRETLWPRYPLPYGISLVEGTKSMGIDAYQMLLDAAQTHRARAAKGPLPDDATLDLLAARVAIVSKHFANVGAPLAGSAAEGMEGMVVVLRPEALPRAWIVHQVERLPKHKGRGPWQLKKRTQAVLFPEGEPRDWRRLAVVETDEPLSLPAGAESPSGDEQCLIRHADPLCVEIEARLASPGLVVLSDLDYPGWELTVDTAGKSEPVPIQRVNRVMRGAMLPAGEHRLVYRYRPQSVFYGGAISALTAIGLILGACLARIRLRVVRRRAGAAASPAVS
jgi:hypothetical protein